MQRWITLPNPEHFRDSIGTFRMWVYDSRGYRSVLSAWCTVEHEGDTCTVTFHDEEGGILLPSHAATPLPGELMPPNPPGE